jgi:hypothetical protein
VEKNQKHVIPAHRAGFTASTHSKFSGDSNLRINGVFTADIFIMPEDRRMQQSEKLWKKILLC